MSPSHKGTCHGLWRKTHVKKITTSLESVFYLFRQLSDAFCRHCSWHSFEVGIRAIRWDFVIFCFFGGVGICLLVHLT